MLRDLYRRTNVARSAIILLIGLMLLPVLVSTQETLEDKVVICEKVLEKILNDGAESGLELYEQYELISQKKCFLDWDDLNWIGINLYRKGRYDDSFVVLRYAIERYQENAFLVDTLAEGYLYKYSSEGDLADLDKSEYYYNEALKIEPGFFYSLSGIRKIFVVRNYDKREYMVPMRDGARLFTQVYVPKNSSEKYPFLYDRTPYNVSPKGERKIDYKDTLGSHFGFTEEGFIFVRQDVRGKFLSEGEFVHVRPVISDTGDSTFVDESTDTYDTIEWLLKSIPNHNGKVDIYGCSYGGFYALVGAINAHPALVAVTPQAPGADWFIGDDWHHNGAFFLMHAINWLRSNDFERPEPIDIDPRSDFTYPYSNAYDFLLKLGPISNMKTHFKHNHPFWNKIFEHPDYDEFWQARNILSHLRNLKPAILIIGGWFDAEDLYGTLASYKEIEKTDPDAKSNIIMGPWYHCNMNNASEDVSEGIRLNMATASRYYNENIILPFFNFHLKSKGEVDIPEALMYDTGMLEWKEFSEWPSSSAKTTSVYLREDSRLSFTKPSADNGYSEYFSDPSKPVPYRERISEVWSYEFMHADQRANSYRPDVLVFETEILENDITVAGPITADLFVSTTGTDADWVVKVIDVYPDDMPILDPNPLRIVLSGYQMLVRGDVMRGKYRNSFLHPEPFVPDQVTNMKLDLLDIFHTFKKGHKIMIQIHSSWFPLVDRNPQKFVNIYEAKEEDFLHATHRVYHSKKFPSRLEFKILENK